MQIMILPQKNPENNSQIETNKKSPIILTGIKRDQLDSLNAKMDADIKEWRSTVTILHTK